MAATMSDETPGTVSSLNSFNITPVESIWEPALYSLTRSVFTQMVYAHSLSDPPLQAEADAMASESEKDAAARTRIITHMNADHQDSLSRYLQYYHSLSSFTSRNAYLSNIDFASMTILSSPHSKRAYRIPISPPMASWSEARPRVVEMDAEATAALGRSGVTVKKYTPPRGFMAIVWMAAFLTFIAFSRRANFRPGSWWYDGLLKYVPTFSRFCWTIQPMVIYPMVVLHAAETVFMERSRLKRHTVKAFGMVWWMWIFSTFVEGVGAFLRFDEVVREEEQRKAKAKH